MMSNWSIWRNCALSRSILDYRQAESRDQFRYKIVCWCCCWWRSTCVIVLQLQFLVLKYCLYVISKRENHFNLIIYMLSLLHQLTWSFLGEPQKQHDNTPGGLDTIVTVIKVELQREGIYVKVILSWRCGCGLIISQPHWSLWEGGAGDLCRNHTTLVSPSVSLLKKRLTKTQYLFLSFSFSANLFHILVLKQYVLPCLV